MRMVLIIIVLLGLGTVIAMASSNVSNLQGNINYDTVYVKAGDTVWSIAAKRVTDKEDIRDFIMAIRKANSLNNNAQIYVGQALKVPVKKLER